MSLRRKIYWTDGNTINMANMDGSNSKVLHQNQRDPAGSSPFFFFPTTSFSDVTQPAFRLFLWCELLKITPPFIRLWSSPAAKYLIALQFLVAVKAQHVSTASTGVASNTRGRGADVIDARQRLSFRLEASDWLSRQGSAWTLTNTYPPPEFTDAFSGVFHKCAESLRMCLS